MRAVSRCQTVPDGFDDFLYKYGSRAPNEWDLRSDSWESKPVLALLAIDGMRLQPRLVEPELIRERNGPSG